MVSGWERRGFCLGALLAFHAIASVLLLPHAAAQDLLLAPAGESAVSFAGARPAAEFPWGTQETNAFPVVPSPVVSVMLSPGDSSEESWRRASQTLAAVLAQVPGGEAEVSILDGFVKRDLGLLSRRTPASRLIAAEHRSAVYASPAPGTAPGVDTGEPEAAQLSLSQLSQALDWIESEPRGWAFLVWIVPESSLSPETRDFVVARLLRGAALSKTRLRLASTTPGGDHQILAGLTANLVLAPFRAEEFSAPQQEATAELFSIPVPGSPYATGYHLHRLRVTGIPGSALEVPWISVGADSRVPSIELFEQVRYLERGLRAKKGEWERQAESREQGAEELRRVLTLNPASAEALELGLELARWMAHPATASDYQVRLLRFEPPNPERLAAAGIAAFDALQFGDASAVLERAAAMETANPRAFHLLAVLSAFEGNHRAVLERSEKALALGYRDAYLHLLRADTFEKTGDPVARAKALLEAIGAGSVPVERRLETADLLLALERSPESAGLLQDLLPRIPEDTGLMERYATLCTRASLPEQALAGWLRVLELEPRNPRAHPALAALHFKAERFVEAAAAAREGLSRNPGESGILIILADALDKQGMQFAARREIRAAGAVFEDIALLERAARLEDETGSGAAVYYRRLLEVAPDGDPRRARWALDGLRCAAREADAEAISWFSGKAQGGATQTAGSPGELSSEKETVLLRGGRKAIYSLLSGTHAPSPSRYLESLSRVIKLRTTEALDDARKAYQETARSLFRALDRLAASGTQETSGVGEHGTIVLKARFATKEQVQATDRWLRLLGFDLNWRSGKASLERHTTGDEAQGGLLATALEVDELALQEAAAAGRDFEIRILNESVPVLLGENAWRSAWGGGGAAGGFPEFLVENPDAATLYLALSQMNAPVVEALVRDIGVRKLAENYGALLSRYGSALELSSDGLVVPGGTASIEAWSALMKARPSNASQFLEALLRKDDGDALGFYALMASLDDRRQAFFGASPQRLQQYYKAYRETPAVKNNQSRTIDQPIAIDFFREIPLDAEGRFQPPGGAALWMIAKGDAEDFREAAKRAEKLNKASAQDRDDSSRDDQVLIRLLREDYSIGHQQHSLFENFLAVARLDARRQEALDPQTAFLLAELGVAFRPVYAYLAHLPMLRADDFPALFSVVSQFGEGDTAERNAEAGQVHAILAIAACASHNGTVEPEAVGAILRDFFRAFPQNRDPSAAMRTTLSAVESFLLASKVPLRNGLDVEQDHRDGLRLLALLAPWLLADSAAEFVPKEVAEDWAGRWEQLARAQQVPSLTRLVALGQLIQNLRANPSAEFAQAEKVAGLIEGWPELSAFPAGINNQRKKNLERYALQALREAVLRLRSEANRGKADPSKIRPDRLQRAATEIESALSPQLTLALSAVVYARFLHPEDLLVAEAPLFLRRHEYVTLTPARKTPVSRTMLEKVGGADGSFFSGGFDGMARVAGDVGADSSMRQSPNTEKLLAAELGSIRSTNWISLTETNTQHFAAQIRAAKDWVVLARTDLQLRRALERATMGLVSNSRRADLLTALQDGDWNRVWSAISLADLLRLALSIPPSLKGLSPAIDRFDPSLPGKAMLAELSNPRDLLRDHALPEFGPLAPYEDSAARPYPALTVSRFAEFKIYFAELLAREGLAASGMLRFAEPAIRAILAEAKIAGPQDWQAILDTYRSMTLSDLQPAGATGRGVLQ